MRSIKIAALFLSALLTGCAGLTSALTPSARVERAQFDGATHIVQDAINVNSSAGEGWNLLGLAWSSKAPETAYIQAGQIGIVSINSVAFNIGGEIREFREPFTLTQFSNAVTAGRSLKTYAVPVEYLRKLAAADLVQLRITSGQASYSDSSFGRSVGQAQNGYVFSQRLNEFLAKIDQTKI